MAASRSSSMRAQSAENAEAAFESMAGLLLTGGADIDPARYGKPNQGSVSIEPARDALEQEAYAAASARGVPILGHLPRVPGDQRLQRRDAPPARRRPCRRGLGPRAGQGTCAAPRARAAAWPGSCRRRIRGPGRPTVNSYHHQAIRAADLAPGPRRECLGRRAPTATSSRASRRPTARSCSASSATRSGPIRRPTRSSACGGSSSTPAGGRSRAPPSGAPRRPTAGRRRSPDRGTGASAARPAPRRSGSAGPPRGSGRRRGSRPGWRCPGRSPSRGSR